MAQETYKPRIEDLLWFPQPGAQTNAYLCPIDNILFAGTRGGGKSTTGLARWIKHLIDNKENQKYCTGLVLRQSIDELRSLMKDALEMYGDLVENFNKTERIMYMRGGGELHFRHMEDEKDLSKFQGKQFSFIFIDEAGELKNFAIVDLLYATMRSSVNLDYTFFLTANPSGPSHLELKSRYVDPAPKGYSILRDEHGSERVYIPSDFRENKIMLAASPDYEAKLLTATETDENKRKAWVYGSWDVSIESLFGKVWNLHKHAIPTQEIPQNCRVYRAYDWGGTSPFAILYFAVMDGETPLLNNNGEMFYYPRDTLVVFDEIYGADRFGKGLETPDIEIADLIHQRDRELGLHPAQIIPGPADHNIFGRHGQHQCANDMYRAKGILWIPAAKGPGSVGDGISVVRDLLKATAADIPEQPGLVVFDRCTQFIRQIPTLESDPKKPNHPHPDQPDHIFDALRYGCTFKRPRVKVSKTRI